MHTLLLTLLTTASLTLPGELIVNGDFEMAPEHNYGWSVRNGKAEITNEDPFHESTAYYLKIHSFRAATVSNSGENGIKVKEKDVLKFSCYYKSNVNGKVILLILDDEGMVAGGKTLRVKAGDRWKEMDESLQVNKDCSNGTLEIVFPEGDFLIDEVSLISAEKLKRQ